MTDLKRTPLPDDRTGMNRRFSLPHKREEGLPNEIKEGLKLMLTITERELKERPPSEIVKSEFAATKNWIDAITAAQPTGERMKIYFTVGLYPDGKPGEVFIKADRSGSLASGALDAVAMMMSIALQYGVPLKVLIDKLQHSHFEPFGWTQDGEFPSASSPLDLLAQWLRKKFASLIESGS